METFFQFPMQAHTAAQEADLAQDMLIMHGVIWVIRLFTLIFAIGLSVLFGRIISRLRGEPVRREFGCSKPPG